MTNFANCFKSFCSIFVLTIATFNFKPYGFVKSHGLCSVDLETYPSFNLLQVSGYGENLEKNSWERILR